MPELGDAGKSMQAVAPQFGAWIRNEVAKAPRAGTDAILVTHQPNIAAAFPADATGLADAIEHLMRDRDLRLLYARNARQIVVDEFSSAHIAKAIVALYARLLAPAPNESRQ